ncbi:hypothetical protein DIPPA_00212 [Diplonema papillatum]|nr:hypothetical protein DIPPA_11777 [Diplonema papillatum]KAJ9462250.1 hypothetical protein DIPPA_00212 [Diplonema papillatum]
MRRLSHNELNGNETWVVYTPTPAPAKKRPVYKPPTKERTGARYMNGNPTQSELRQQRLFEGKTPGRERSRQSTSGASDDGGRRSRSGSVGSVGFWGKRSHSASVDGSRSRNQTPDRRRNSRGPPTPHSHAAAPPGRKPFSYVGSVLKTIPDGYLQDHQLLIDELQSLAIRPPGARHPDLSPQKPRSRLDAVFQPRRASSSPYPEAVIHYGTAARASVSPQMSRLPSSPLDPSRGAPLSPVFSASGMSTSTSFPTMSRFVAPPTAYSVTAALSHIAESLASLLPGERPDSDLLTYTLASDTQKSCLKAVKQIDAVLAGPLSGS